MLLHLTNEIHEIHFHPYVHTLKKYRRFRNIFCHRDRPLIRNKKDLFIRKDFREQSSILIRTTASE